MERDELQEYLNALGRSDCYRVDAVLKDSAIERTERVFFVGSNGSEFGPFIRKIIANESGQGRVYEKLYRAQQAGKRFAHLPRVYECYSTDSSLVVVIEFIQGETLQQRVEGASQVANTAAQQSTREQLAHSIFPALCDAVRELHEAFDPPIIHRDLTPANIIVSEGNVTLIDLGIARTFHPDAQRDTTYFGTRDYAPPEQFGFGQTDVRSDVYAMGKVLQFCVGGKDAAQETSSVKALSCEDSPKNASIERAASAGLARETAPASTSIDPHIAAVIAKATQLDPAQRFQTVADLKAAFLSAVEISAASEPTATSHPEVPSTDSTSTTALSNPESAVAVVNSSALPAAAAQIAPPPPPEGSPVIAWRSARTAEAPRPATPPVPKMPKKHQPAIALTNLFTRIPTAVGIVWDCFVILTWALLFLATNLSIIYPTSGNELHPLWFRILEFYGLVTVPTTLLSYYLLDLRPLKRRFPNARILTRGHSWIFSLAIVLVLVIAITAVANYTGIASLSA